MSDILDALLALVGVVRSGRCRCGHPREAHEHYRTGTECSRCSRMMLGPGGTLVIVAPCRRYRSTWRRA